MRVRHRSECRCKPFVMATFRHQAVVELVQVHSTKSGCFRSIEFLDIHAYVTRHEKVVVE